MFSRASGLVPLLLLAGCGGGPDAKAPGTKGLHDDDWREKLDAEPRSVAHVRLDGHRYLVRDLVVHLPFRIGTTEYSWPKDEKNIPVFMDVIEEKTGKVVVPPAQQIIRGVDDYGIFVVSHQKRFETHTGELVATDVVEVGGTDLAKRAYVTRELPDKRGLLDVVSPKGVRQFEVDPKRGHPWDEAVDGFAVIRAIDGNRKALDVLVDADTKPVAAPTSGLEVIPARRFIQDNLYDTYKDNPAYFGSFVAVRAPGSAPEDELWWILDKNGHFGAPAGARGFLQIPFTLDGKPTQRDRPLPYWFVRYDVEGDRVKKWGTASGMLDSISAPRWFDVRRVTTDYAMRGGEMICGQDEKGWDCFPIAETLKPDLAVAEPRPALHGSTIADAFVREAAFQVESLKQQTERNEAERRFAIWRKDQESFDAAWAGKPSTEKAVAAAWNKAVATNDRAAIARIVVWRTDDAAWSTFLDGVDVALLPTETLRAAFPHTTGARRDTIAAKLDATRRAEEARVKREREQEAKYLQQQAVTKPYPVNPAPGSVYVAPSSQSGANAGASQEQQMRNYSRELDSKIYGNGGWKR